MVTLAKEFSRGTLLVISETPRAMALFDPEFVRKVAGIAASATSRFDPALCGKVLRIAAAVSLIEFLLTIGILMIWIPAHSTCPFVADPISLYMLLFLSGAPALWLCFLAIFWTHLARDLSAWNESLSYSKRPKWLSFGHPFSLPIPFPTALLILIFCFFAGFAALPFVLVLQNCGS